MLIFYRKSLEENIEKFVENIKKASKNFMNYARTLVTLALVGC